MTSEPPIEKPVWISEAEVVSMIDIAGAIDALQQSLLAEARNEAQNMIKTPWSGTACRHCTRPGLFSGGRVQRC
jgi:hypothetical protein